MLFCLLHRYINRYYIFVVLSRYKDNSDSIQKIKVGPLSIPLFFFFFLFYCVARDNKIEADVQGHRVKGSFTGEVEQSKLYKYKLYLSIDRYGT